MLKKVWISFEYLSVTFAEAIGGRLRAMWAELDLFLGALLLLLGLLNWSSGKYCDGNTADYLSCTNPATYYYYNALEIGLIVLGALLILVWFVKNRQK
jgi:hypothetical protein